MERTDQRPEGPRVPRSPRTRASIALVAAGLVSGAVIAGTLAAGAQSTPPIPSATEKAEHRGGQHAGETLLTGTTADKVKAAALKALPGGTIERVETDAEGSPYEAHMTKADDTRVTVKVDENFKVTAIEEGHGRRGSGTN